MYQQGDVLLFSFDEIPVGKKKASNHLAEGEATGHMHELDSGQLYEKNGILYFKVATGESTTLGHPEHKPVTFAPGNYEVTRQREYTPDNWKRKVYVRD